MTTEIILHPYDIDVCSALIAHMVPEGVPGQKKNTIQVSYLSEIVSTSRFGICKNEIIS